MIWCEKIDVKYVMNAPLRGKFQSVVDRGHHLNDGKGAMLFGHKLYRQLICPEVVSFQPYHVSFLVFGHIFVFDP